uniref:Uncharacterized protein n=1 Tax=Streptomyces sp. FR1 TaxID=349971 RepID=I1VH24_9ACTN|nr:hypothetical protein [Streptomyces sp. FR1]AFI44022.1 hypothetical protein pFP4.23c [Streptomyces sp. FR1]
MPLHTDADKALRQLTRRDPAKVKQYRAELKYFHVPRRAILGISTTHQILDEAVTWSTPPNVWPLHQRTPQA